MITTADTQPVDYFITAGRFHDSTALQAMQVEWPRGSELYGDSGYTDYEQEALYAECDQSYRRMHRKQNRSGAPVLTARSRLGCITEEALWQAH